MKRSIFLFVLLCLGISFYAQEQRSAAQELVDLLLKERYFEARDFKKQYADLLPKNDRTLDLLYDIHMALAFNKLDSAVIYLEEFLNGQDTERLIGPIIDSYYGRLAMTYEEMQQYKQSICVTEKYMNYLKRNPFSMDREFIEKETRDMKNRLSSLNAKLGNEPLRRIKRDSDVHEIKLKNSDYIRFDAIYNGHEIETLFNTDVGTFFVMEEDVANEIGVKVNSYQNVGTQMPNGAPPIIVYGMLDSIDFKGVKLYNIPVTIFKGKFSSILPSDLDPKLKSEIETDFFKDRQIVMGVSAMKMLKRLEFDWKSNVLRLPSEQISEKKDSVPNFMLLRSIPYLHMSVNEKSFTGRIDTSSKPFLYLMGEFISSDQPEIFTRVSFLQYNPHVERYRIIKTPISFDGKNINSELFDIHIVDPKGAKWKVFDGEVGVDFIKKNGSKTLLNFDTMMVKFVD